MLASGVPTALVALAAAVGVVLVALAAVLIFPRRRTDEGDDGADSDGRNPRRAAMLRCVGGAMTGQTWALDAEVTTLGSLEGATIVLADPEVARKHAAIRRSGTRLAGFARGSGRFQAQYELADLGSIQGVMVNGERMAKRVLASGDIIRLGTIEMVFRIEKVG